MPCHHHSQLLAGLVLAAMAAAGCGSDSKPADSKPAAKDASERSATVDLEPFLMRDGEEPGFRRVERAGTDSFDEFVKNVTEAEARALRRAGFISITYQRIGVTRNATGISNVQLFKTAKGAQDTLAYELRTDVIRSRLPGAKIRRFTVPGIPGARGWTSPAPGHPVGNVHWVQGRCMLVLGNQGPGPLARPLSTGARAIHQRTKRKCPSSGSDAEPTDLAALVDESKLAGIASVKGDVEEHDDPQTFAVANTWVYNVGPGDAFGLGKRLGEGGFVAGAVHYYGHRPGVPTHQLPKQSGYRSLIRFAGADAAKKEAREQVAAAFRPCPNEACATSRRVTVTCIPDATGASLIREVRGERRYEYVVVFSKGAVVGQVGASSIKKDLEDKIAAAARELYGSVHSAQSG